MARPLIDWLLMGGHDEWGGGYTSCAVAMASIAAPIGQPWQCVTLLGSGRTSCTHMLPHSRVYYHRTPAIQRSAVSGTQFIVTIYMSAEVSNLVESLLSVNIG